MKPTVGRIVYFTFTPDTELSGACEAGQSRTVPAIIVAVWSDTCVNLRVFQDGTENPLWITSVSERDEGNEQSGNFWEWPKRD